MNVWDINRCIVVDRKKNIYLRDYVKRGCKKITAIYIFGVKKGPAKFRKYYLPAEITS